MHNPKTTPVPNILFDSYLKYLTCVEIKLLLVIVRKTLGWKDMNGLHGRKEIDWISGSQLQKLTGCSKRAISSATESLISKMLIDVLDEKGNSLSDPGMRQGKQKLYYRLSPCFELPVNNQWKRHEFPSSIQSASAKIAEDISKKVSALAQKMRITKETLQN